MLKAKNLSFEVSGRRLIDNVSVTIAPGEMLAVVGPNGAGKTTLLRLLAGDLRPKQGEVRLMDMPLSRWNARALAQRRGILMQQTVLNFPLSVLEVVMLGRMPHGHGGLSAESQTIAAQALQQVGMGAFAERRYTTLSGGEQKRVQLARVLAQIWEPPATGARYLMLDEPVASLDLAYQQQMLHLGRVFADAGTAVLAILHDLNLASQYADRLLMLKAGRVVACGPPDEVMSRERISDLYDTDVLVMAHPSTGKPLIALQPQA